MVMTPIKAFVGGEEVSSQRPLLCSEGKSAAPGSHLNTSGSGEVESSSSAVAEGDLPGQFTRVMGKGVCVCVLCVVHPHAAASQRLCLVKANSTSVAPACLSVCTQLLVSRSDEDCISSYLQLIDKCLIHEVPPSQSTACTRRHTLHHHTAGCLLLRDDP